MNFLKNKKYLVSIIVLVCILLIVGSIILVNIFGDKTIKPTYTAEWMHYLMDSDIKNIELTYCVDRQLTEDFIMPEQKTITISKNDLTKVFNEMDKGTVTRNYYGGLGASCITGISIDYKTTDDYNLFIFLSNFLEVALIKDEQLLTHLSKVEYTIKTYSDELDLDTAPYLYDYTYDKTVIDNIIKEYTEVVKQ